MCRQSVTDGEIRTSAHVETPTEHHLSKWGEGREAHWLQTSSFIFPSCVCVCVYHVPYNRSGTRIWVPVPTWISQCSCFSHVSSFWRILTFPLNSEFKSQTSDFNPNFQLFYKSLISNLIPKFHILTFLISEFDFHFFPQYADLWYCARPYEEP